MKLFIAGATGAVGRLLLPKLLRAGHEVIAITRNKRHIRTMESMGARALIADVFDREAVITTVREARPDAVIHQLTALSAMDFAENSRIRKEGTRNLVDAALAAGVDRIVAQSISFVYEPGEQPASEDVSLDVNAPEPRKSTVDGVVALKRTSMEMQEHVILRYGLFYGPGTWLDRNGLIAEKVLRKEVPATDGISSFIHVEDVANAAFLALDWPSGTVNIVDNEPATGTHWLPVYASALGAPKPDYKPGLERGERGASNIKARREYRWEPLYPTWRSGFFRSLASK